MYYILGKGRKMAEISGVNNNSQNMRLSQIADYQRAKGKDESDNVVIYNISEEFQENIEKLEDKKPDENSAIFEDWMADYGQTLRDAIKESHDNGNFESYEVPKEYQDVLESMEDKKPSADSDSFNEWAQLYEDAMMDIVDKVQDN